MLGKAQVIAGELIKLRQRFRHIAGVQRLHGDHQQVIARAAVAEGDIAERILHRHRFRIALLNQALLVSLRVQQTVALQKASCGHRIGERQIGALHGDRTIEVGVGPDIEQMAGEKGGDKQRRQRLAERAPVQAAQLLPAPGGEQHLHEENQRHADKHQLPVARHLALVRVDHQLPHHRIKVEMEAVEHRAVDHNQRQSDGGDNRRQDAQQPLRHHHEGERKYRQQINGEHNKAEVADPAAEGVNAPRERRGPVGDHQIAAA